MHAIAHALVHKDEESVIESPLVLLKHLFVWRFIIYSYGLVVYKPFHILWSPHYAIYMPLRYIHLILETVLLSVPWVVNGKLGVYVVIRLLLAAKHLHHVYFSVRGLGTAFLLSA